MKLLNFSLVEILIMVFMVNCQRNLIIDSDMLSDDAGALCIAHALADMGETEILAIVHNGGYKRGIGAVSVLNHYYGRDNILLGAFKGEFGTEINGAYIDHLVENWESPIKSSDQVPEAVQDLRQTLADAEHSSVTYAAIGFLTNLANLLKSPADTISSLSGYELVRDKVMLVTVMGGYYPSSKRHSEYKLNCGQPYMGPPIECEGTSAQAIDMMPPNVKMIFSGFETGVKVMSGGILTRCSGEDNPCRAAYIDLAGENTDISSWDPLSLLMTVRGAEAIGGYENGKGGTNLVTEDGANRWIEGESSNQTYLKLHDFQFAGDEIDNLLCQSPLSKY